VKRELCESHLEISKLESSGTFAHSVCCFFQCPCGLHLTLGGNHLCTRLSVNQNLMDFCCRFCFLLLLLILTSQLQLQSPLLSAVVLADSRPFWKRAQGGQKGKINLCLENFLTISFFWSARSVGPLETFLTMKTV
jgi:hypothetical protein